MRCMYTSTKAEEVQLIWWSETPRWSWVNPRIMGRAFLLDACGVGRVFRTGVLEGFDACKDGSSFGTRVLVSGWPVLLIGPGYGTAAAVGKVFRCRLGLTLTTGTIVPRPTPGSRFGIAPLDDDAWGCGCGICLALTTMGVIVIVFTGGR